MKHLNKNKFEPIEFDWTKSNSTNSNAFEYFNPLEKMKLKRKKSIMKIILHFISLTIWAIGLIVSINYIFNLF